MSGSGAQFPATRSGRRAGRWDAATEFGSGDHGCVGYSSGTDRADAVAAWLADGLRIGQRAWYIFDGPVDDALSELTALDVDDLRRSRALEVMSCTEVYDLAVPIEPADQLSAYAAAVERAVADGFNGLRVAADITPLVTDPARRASHLRWEQIADRYMTDHPLAPLCLYDTRQIDNLEAIVASHPLQGPNCAPFALYGGGPRRAVLDGEVDAMADEPFTELLDGLPVADDELDLSRLAFIDGHIAYRLHEQLLARRRAGQHLALVAASPLVRRVWSLCGFDSDLLAA